MKPQRGLIGEESTSLVHPLPFTVLSLTRHRDDSGIVLNEPPLRPSHQATSEASLSDLRRQPGQADPAAPVFAEVTRQIPGSGATRLADEYSIRVAFTARSNPGFVERIASCRGKAGVVLETGDSMIDARDCAQPRHVARGHETHPAVGTGRRGRHRQQVCW